MNQRHRSVLIAVALAASFGSGCERHESKAKASADADPRWEALLADLDSDRLSVHQKLQKLQEFEAVREDDQRYDKELARRRQEIEKLVEADFAAQASRAKAYRAQQQAESEKRRRAIMSSSLTSLAGEILFRFAPWQDHVERDGFEPVSMRVSGKEPRVRRSPFENMGMGSMRLALTDLMAETAPTMLGEDGQYHGRHDRMNASFNALLLGRLGARLFDEDNPGVIHARALQKLLDEVYVGPDAPLLGTRARDVYRLFRPIVWGYARVYLALNKRFGKRKLVAEYKKGRRKYNGSSYEKSMLVFYEQFTRQHAITSSPGTADSWDTSVIVGFWMRRAADGTDRLLVGFLRKVADDYDPDLVKLLR